jgi:acetyl esterase
MSLDPPLQRLFAAFADSAAPEPADLAERRLQADTTMLLAATGAEPGVTLTDHEVPVDGGTIPVRIARPSSVPAPAPTLFFIHGGGWFQGNLDTAAVECGPMASAVPCTVVSVGYRLAPEHPFPVPLDDCLAAFTWLHERAESLGVDPQRIAVGGTSAGGNLAAALCLAVRDRGLPLPVAQFLDVPALDLTLASPSMAEPAAQAGLTRDAVAEYADLYLGDHDRTDPLVSPLLADDLSGLPPAVIVVAEHDPVRDDGERYLARLHDADVPAAAVRVLAHPHGGWVVPITVTHHLVNDLRAAAIRRALAGTLDPLASFTP